MFENVDGLSSAAVVIGALRVKLQFDFKTFVLSIFEWPHETGFFNCTLNCT